ncbi:MAG: hypothetical protein ACR2OR_10130 [Hyphomicrobiales bacterium]
MTFAKPYVKAALAFIFALFLPGIVFPAACFAETKPDFMSVIGVTPEGQTCLIGGSYRGVIAEPDVLVDFMKHKQSYAIVRLDEVSGDLVSIGKPEAPDTGGDCEQSYLQELSFSSEQLGPFQLAVRTSEDDAKKRLAGTFTEVSTDSESHKKLVEEHLKSAGLENPDVKLKQVLSADIDGDGKSETLINAVNTVREDIKKGEYSLVLLVRGGLDDPKIINVHSEIVLLDENEPSMMLEQTIVALFDVEGDGKQELVLYGAFAFGEGWQIIKVREKETEQILFCGCG